MIKISVITVARNSEKTIESTLKSIESQIYRNIEIIIVDGRSTDATLEVVTKFYNEKFILVSQCGDGIFDAMNVGISAASGDIIGFLNSDDYYYNNSILEKIAIQFNADEHLDVVYGDLVYVNNKNSRAVRYWHSKGYVYGDFIKGWCPPHPTFYVSKKLIKNIGLFDTNLYLAADMDFMLRCLEIHKAKFVHLNQLMVVMRLGGVSNRNIKNIVIQNYQIFLSLKKNYSQIPYAKFIFMKFYNRFIQYFYGLFFNVVNK